MTRKRHRYSTRAIAIVGIVLALTAGSGLAAAVGPAGASDAPAPAVDGNGDVAVTLAEAPDGIQRYNVTVSLDSASGTTIESASAGDINGFEVRSQTDDSITFRAADLGENVSAGASDVSLGTISLAGGDASDAEFSVTTHDFRNDESEQIDPDLSVGQPETGGSGATGGGLTDSLPGTPVVWAVGAVGFTLVVGALVVLRR